MTAAPMERAKALRPTVETSIFSAPDKTDYPSNHMAFPRLQQPFYHLKLRYWSSDVSRSFYAIYLVKSDTKKRAFFDTTRFGPCHPDHQP